MSQQYPRGLVRLSGQKAAGVPGVDLAHVVWVCRGIRGERRVDIPHEGKGRLCRSPQS